MTEPHEPGDMVEREVVAAIVGDAIYGPSRRETYRHVTLPCADKILTALASSGADRMREALEQIIPLLRATDELQANGFASDAVNIARQALGEQP